MEIDENLKYTLYVGKSPYLPLLIYHSLQFDPCPRAGEPMVSRRQFPDFKIKSKLTTSRHPRLLPLDQART